MSAQFTPGPWVAQPCDDDTYAFGILDNYARPTLIADVVSGPTAEIPQAQAEANARLIAAAPDYAEACGLTLHPGENESCGPLSWLRTAIDTLHEDAVREAASGDDPDAYWFMLNEVETLHARLTAASAKARGEQAQQEDQR